MFDFLTTWEENDPKYLVVGILAGCYIMYLYRGSLDFRGEKDKWNNFYLSRFLLGAFVTLLCTVVFIYKLVDGIIAKMQ